MDFCDEAFREAGFAELAGEGGAFREGADDSDEGDFREAPKGFREDGEIGGMTLGDGEELGFFRDEGEGIGVGVDEVGREIWLRRDFRKPLGAGIDEVDAAGEGGEDGEQCLDDVAGSENGDVPGGGGANELEEESHFTSAGHGDVLSQVPSDELAGRRCGIGEEG